MEPSHSIHSLIRLYGSDKEEVMADVFRKVAEEDAMMLRRITHWEWARIAGLSYAPADGGHDA